MRIMVRFVQVILPLKLEWEPVYAVDDLVCGSGALCAGTRLRVDFAGKEYIAVVSNTDASKEAEAMGLSKVKPVLSPASGLDPIDINEIALWRQVASYYLCTVGEVYKAAYPAGKTADEEAVAQRIRKAQEKAAEKEAITRAKAEAKAAREARAAAKAAEKAAKAAARAAKAAAGKATLAYSQTGEKGGTGEASSNAAAAGKATLAYSQTGENSGTGEASSNAAAAGKATPAYSQTGENSGTGEAEKVRDGADGQFRQEQKGGIIRLSEEQTRAYSEIREILRNGKPALLHGITGSGKTEIYLKFAQTVLSKGWNVLFLVPEIALSRQLEDRLRSIFPEELRVFHSGETAVSRRETATFIKSNPYIVLGTRSSLFLPHRKLGLIIVDEEQDTSYKQDSPAPRYHGRDTAIMLAQIFHAGIILGSATPSLESLYNCSVGRFGKVLLNSRFYQGADSDVEIVDTIAERKKNGMEGQFSKKLIARIRERLASGEQVVLLRERRAYSPVVQCVSCGEIPKCKRCNVPVSLHRSAEGKEKLRCHHCGKVYEYAAVCPKCGGALKPVGAGTQKIEEEAQKLFPDAVTARLDSDTAQSRNYTKEVVEKFSKGEIDILIGTQIVTKGFDFSGLTLVAVLQADSILGQQDFRADEKGLQMLEQFRGRCGRREKKGLFVIQTSQPGHPVYRAIAGQIDESLLHRNLLEERKVFEHPPYTRAVNAVLRDWNSTRLDCLSYALAGALRLAGIPPTVRIVGPYPPAVDKIGGQHIRIIRILLPKDRQLSKTKESLSKAVLLFEKERKYQGHIALDVDPV